MIVQIIISFSFPQHDNCNLVQQSENCYKSKNYYNKS